PQLVELDQVAEDQPSGTIAKRGQRRVDALFVVCGVIAACQTSPADDVVDFADGDDLEAGLAHAIGKRDAGRLERPVFALGSPHESAFEAGEWARDDAPHGVLAAKDRAGRLAIPV